jgi:HK97 gp10 family phage protein
MPSWSCKIISDTVTPKLAAFAGKLQKEVEAELDVVGADMEDLARSLVPVRTGFLRDSIYHKAAEFELEFGATADYSSYVEFGTSRMPARPYLRPALDGSMQRIADAILTGCYNALGL